MDTKYQRAKIVVEETRRFYFQIIFTIGIFIVILARFLFIGRSSLAINPSSFIGENISSTAMTTNFDFVSSPIFILLYLGVVFFIFTGFRYFKLYLLKRSFNNEESGIKKLKKYMKTNEIPSNEEIDARFHEDKNKEKKRFYILVVRVIILNIILYYIYSNFFNNSFFFEIILAFSVLTLIYRYLIVFHADKKLFNNEWKNNKIEEYIQKYNI